VLYGRLRPYLNKVWVAEFDGLCSSEFLVFAKREGLDSQFLARRLNAEDFVQFANEQVSGERPRVNFEKLSRFAVALPPPAEQQRIAAKLSSALSQVEQAETAVRRAQKRLADYRISVLDAAVSGMLTRASRRAHPSTRTETGETLLRRLLDDRRARWEDAKLRRLRAAGKQPKDDTWKTRYRQPISPNTTDLTTLPERWTWASIDQLSWDSGYGTSVKCTYDSKGPAVLRIPNIRNRTIDFRDLKFASSSRNLIATQLIAPGDLLLIRTNGSKSLLGRAAVVRSEPNKKCTFASYLIRFRLLGEEQLWSWLAFAWDSQVVRAQIEGKAKTTAGQYNVSLSGLSDIAIPIPPPEEQVQSVRQVDRRLSAAGRLEGKLAQQLVRAHLARQSLLRDAFNGSLVPQDPHEEPAFLPLDRLRNQRTQEKAGPKKAPQGRQPTSADDGVAMQQPTPSPNTLRAAWKKIDNKTDARRLFDEAGFVPDQVVQFYEALRATPELREAFLQARQVAEHGPKPASHAKEKKERAGGRLRLLELWLEDFKNLKDYTVRFNPSQGLDVFLGWNGTGKSNLFEALVIIFRDLHDWWERNRWPDKPMNGFRIRYEMDRHTVEVTWRPGEMKRPDLKWGPIVPQPGGDLKWQNIRREQLPLPRFVFGYYSGPTNRLAEHFLPMKQAHYVRLREAKTDDARTLAKLLEQRRFFCAETHHAKYVLLGFSYKEDQKISEFLENRLRIVGFESALFIIRKPRWARSKATAQDFWGATGIMRRVMERLRRYAIAPMVLEQNVSDGYRSTTEEHYYFFLPNLESLHSFAAEYQDARTFFLALESTDFSELIHDVKIQVRVKSTNTDQVPITFHQLSEGEQQLLMVLGLMRFTKSHQSLVLLDEPDTHLNPHWSVDYVKDLARVMSDNALESTEQQSSQILMATHDPLVIASLVKEQVHILKRDSHTGVCKWAPASVNPRGLGFTGILTSEMFGFRSDLDPETLADLDNRVRLVSKEESLTSDEKKQLETIDKRLTDAGFSKSFSDPYYAAFVRAWGRRYSDLMASQQFLTAEQRQEIDRIASEVLKEAVAEVEKEASD